MSFGFPSVAAGMAAPTSRFAALFSATVRISVSSGNSGARFGAFVRPIQTSPPFFNSPLSATTTTSYTVSGVRPVIVVAVAVPMCGHKRQSYLPTRSNPTLYHTS